MNDNSQLELKERFSLDLRANYCGSHLILQITNKGGEEES